MYFEYPNMPFVTSDTHYFHKNIIKYCDRPFRSEAEMRHTLIERYNSVVPKDGTCFFIGDLAMVGTSQFEKITALLNKLNGTKHLILGNHDECKPMRYVNCGFTSVHTSLVVRVEMKLGDLEEEVRKFVLCHDPAVWDCVPRDHILLCGHVHNLFKILPDKETINVGVDVWGFYPQSFQNVWLTLEDWKRDNRERFKMIPLREEVIRPDQETG